MFPKVKDSVQSQKVKEKSPICFPKQSILPKKAFVGLALYLKKSGKDNNNTFYSTYIPFKTQSDVAKRVMN